MLFTRPTARLLPLRSLRRLPLTARPLSTSRAVFAAKDSQDKDSIKRVSTEYSKSGSDEEVAESDAAFNPDKTSPESAEATAEDEAGGKDNTLNVSPGNPSVSEPNDPGVGGSGGSPRDKTSGAGGAQKNGGGESG
ncbi:hypothetical protein P153DRAFT_371182 [Dothidotthia symphoricarpi CBS 119687]|uniref:Uncharacterized protein n=1 Tax=Dothidotthia symphoricarpi CBS 119687 TaxID=1392245 RepID=A0A6A5ZY84_9PLEO|nr:uncharacterized protein P153DRAFT_371182 [Dothidotthia symphoricarpi CBS 119687]KAF2123843.1 hypothetical protein P153DRAFT_371182 [Dothidotthia symphoricarpi CBS 119687]